MAIRYDVIWSWIH